MGALPVWTLFFFFFLLSGNFSLIRTLLLTNQMWDAVVQKNRMVWTGGSSGMIPFQPPPWAGPPATAPVCPQSHPAWPWTTDRSCFCHSNSPWHICFHRRFPLLLPFTPLGLEWPNCLFIPGYSPGLTCLPDSTQSLPWKPWEPPEEPGALGDAAGPEHLGAASRNSHIPSHPCKAKGQGSRALQRATPGGRAAPVYHVLNLLFLLPGSGLRHKRGNFMFGLKCLFILISITVSAAALLANKVKMEMDLSLQGLLSPNCPIQN